MNDNDCPLSFFFESLGFGVKIPVKAKDFENDLSFDPFYSPDWFKGVFKLRGVNVICLLFLSFLS